MWLLMWSHIWWLFWSYIWWEIWSDHFVSHLVTFQSHICVYSLDPSLLVGIMLETLHTVASVFESFGIDLLCIRVTKLSARAMPSSSSLLLLFTLVFSVRFSSPPLHCLSRCLPKVARPNVAAPSVAIVSLSAVPMCHLRFWCHLCWWLPSTRLSLSTLLTTLGRVFIITSPFLKLSTPLFCAGLDSLLL